MVDVSVKIDLKGIEKKLSPEAIARGKLAIANQMMMDMERFVPKQKGYLRASGHVNKDSVVYATPTPAFVFMEISARVSFLIGKESFSLLTKMNF